MTQKNNNIKYKKNRLLGMTAYQLFCKEYRASINTELQGLDFGELSKKLADVWKQLPEGDKEVWKERAQYLQHKQQLKASSTSVKRADIRPELPVVNGASEEAEPPLSPVRVPEVDPINAAAHLQLLGESLSLIGYRLQETEGMVTVSGSLSVLLDSVLCALGPLACLTAQVPELNGCPQHVLSDTLDNIAHVMPGL
uniref:HMG box domain-containing protein n=1 Tax=Denticeps clupeoides TaxID=299321 RepID=A0AAY3ZUI8_9TELE